jgi:hypothetical protein
MMVGASGTVQLLNGRHVYTSNRCSAELKSSIENIVYSVNASSSQKSLIKACQSLAIKYLVWDVL